MKKAKYAIIAIALVCIICTGFYFVSKGQQTDEKQLTDIEKVILKDLEKDYPKTARSVMTLYNRILKGYYGGEATDAQIEKLADQMLCLLDEDLLLVNSRDEYLASVKADVKKYKAEKTVLLSTDVADSNDIKYINDKKEGTTEVDELAYVKASYFTRTDGSFNTTNQEFVLRKDDEGRWKIISFYEIEGDSSNDD